MMDELLERTQTGGGILDRAGGLTTYTDSSKCAMVICPYTPTDGHKYCDVCRAIWPDLSLLLALSIQKVREEKNES